MDLVYRRRVSSRPGIGGIGRLVRPDKRYCWAWLTFCHRESDATVHLGKSITGSTFGCWVAIEARQRARPGGKLTADGARIIATRGHRIGVATHGRGRRRAGGGSRWERLQYDQYYNHGRCTN
ncbi:MAG: hypothetical protein ACRDTD_23805 [Pseudonocardiaceae bacterium]